MNEIVDIYGNNREAVQENSSCDAKILGTDTDTSSLQLSKDGVSFFIEKKDIPCMEIANGLNQGGMPVGRFARVVSILVEVCEPPLQLLLNRDRGREELLARRATYFRL